MVNTRRTGTGSDQQEQNNQSTGQPLPMPPPLTPEQFFQLQMQMMATLNNTVQALQQIHAQPPPPPLPQPRDTGSSTRVHSRGLQRASNGIIPWPVG
jgi:hypothetical protein